MRWLARRSRWALAVVFVVLLLAVVLGWVRSVHVATGMAMVRLFLFFFALLMALVRRRETPRLHSPR
jgi:Ni,Fe-hydrogenase I cytochrome b subunit